MRSIIAATLALILTASPANAAAPREWDGLLRITAKHVDAAYLLPSADFRGYTKVLLEPTEVAFRKNWQRDTNSSSPGHISDADARRILEGARQGFETIIRKEYEKAGFTVVTSPGSDVLRVSTAIINLDIEAPDIMTAGRSRTYSRDAGSATLAVEARDSVTGALLGRAVDGQTIGDFGLRLRNSATNSADFERLFASWAKIAATALVELQQLSPIDASGKLSRR